MPIDGHGTTAGRGHATAYTQALRIGVLTIPDEVVATEELRVLLEPAPAMYQHRVDFEERDSPANRVAAMNEMRHGVRILLRTRPDVIVFACTSGGVFAGAQWHRQLMNEMRQLCGETPFFTAAEAVKQTITAAGLKRIALATPYSDDTVEKLVEVLEESDASVVSRTMLFEQGYPGPWTVMSASPDAVADLAIRANDARADVVFVSCAGLVSTPILARTEAEIEKPLVTSNSALAKVIRDILGLGALQGFGSLLASSAIGVQ